MIGITNEMIFQPEVVIERLKGELEAEKAELARLQKIEAEMSKAAPITAEQVAAYQQQQQAAELKAQEACITELVQVADAHGYVIAAVPVQMQSALPGTMMIGAQWGLQRK